MKMSFYKLLIISNLLGYLTACRAGGREFEPRPHRWKRSLAFARLRFLVYIHLSFRACRGISPCPPLPAAGDDLKRDLGGIPLLFVMRDDLKRDMAQIPLLFVCMLEFRWAHGPFFYNE